MDTQSSLNQVFEEFQQFVSIAELVRRYNLKRKKLTKFLKEYFGDEYFVITNVTRLKSARENAAKTNTGRTFKQTPEWIEKRTAKIRGKKLSLERRKRISEGSKKRKSTGRTPESYRLAGAKARETKLQNGAYERHSKWMKEYAPNRGKKASVETRQKLSDAKKAFFKNGGVSNQLGQKRSLETRELISQNTTQMWVEGKFTYGDDFVSRSKLECAVFDFILSFYPDARHSFLIIHDRAYCFDIFIPSLNTLIEVNGDYWHLNPNKYSATFFDEHREVLASDIWERDEKKLQVARDKGFRTVVLWETQLQNNFRDVITENLYVK